MERIRELRQAKGVSQAKLAVTAGMDPATLNRIEQGKANPNLRTLEKLADALGVGVADFFREPAALPKGGTAPSASGPSSDKGSIFGGFIVSAADRLLKLASESGKNPQKLAGISEAAYALGDDVFERVDEAFWDSLYDEERLDIIRGMETLSEVIERAFRAREDEMAEKQARLAHAKIREWNRRIERMSA